LNDKYDILEDSETDWNDYYYWMNREPEMIFWPVDVQCKVMYWYHKRHLQLDPYNIIARCVYQLKLKSKIDNSSYLKRF